MSEGAKKPATHVLLDVRTLHALFHTWAVKELGMHPGSKRYKLKMKSLFDGCVGVTVQDETALPKVQEVEEATD